MCALTLQSASPASLPEVQALLRRAGLPTDGVAAHLATFLVARVNGAAGALVGCAGFEPYDQDQAVLVRSIAVDLAYRGRGLGQRLTEAVLTKARERGAQRAYLLTDTADDFFPRFGFHQVDRDHVPASVKTSVEFTSACPQNARVLSAALS